MEVQALRESRKGATVIYTKFTRLRSKYNTSLFCCFEGDDSKYYGWRIQTRLNLDIDNLQFFNCGGKSEVLRFYNMINKNNDYMHVNLAYFVDRDFDESIIDKYSNEIYETPCYAIENFYTTISAIKRILKCEFNFDESEKDYYICLNLFIERQKEFHEKTKLFNAWLCCQRDLSNEGKASRLNLDNFNLSKIIPEISLAEIKVDYDKQKIESLFPEGARISDDTLSSKMDDMNKLNSQQCFRGKFEIDFLYAFIEVIKIEFSKPNPIITKQFGVKINQSKKNLISELSQYSDTSKCLLEYLDRFAM